MGRWLQKYLPKSCIIYPEGRSLNARGRTQFAPTGVTFYGWSFTGRREVDSYKVAGYTAKFLTRFFF